MKTYQKNGFEYFWDTNIRMWTVYPIDNEGNRIEWDADGDPIEASYFRSRQGRDHYINQIPS